MANIRKVHPGVYIKDLLEDNEMTSKELSIRTGISERTLSSIINENGRVTFDVAYKLSLFFDNSITFWTNLQTQYDLYLIEQNKEKELEEEWKLIKNIKSYLIDFGYISKNDNKDIIINKCRNICGVNSLTLLTKEDTFVNLKEQKVSNENDTFSQNFWISLALNEARKKSKNTYSKQKLVNVIPTIRKMTKEDPKIFYPQLVETLSDCGISFVLLPYLPKSNIYGATKWFSKDNVMLAISNRGEKADLFWFTLFHEISHVLMEHRRETLFNIKGNEDEKADKIASNMIIPDKKWHEFISSNNHYTIDTIRSFAKEEELLPCIVLGRLHKEKIIPYGRFDNELNVSYKIRIY